MTRIDAILQYVRRIRNSDKRDYALRYALWLARTPEVKEVIVEPQPFHLSYMAAQAVRMELHKLWGAK